MGDSLADSGTFGFKFTVQGAQSFIYPERVATKLRRFDAVPVLRLHRHDVHDQHELHELRASAAGA